MTTIIYFVGNKRDYLELSKIIRFPTGTIRAARLKDIDARSGPAVVFISAHAYSLREYVAIRNQLKANHPDAVIVRFQ